MTYPVVFISFDEPNADEHYHGLLQIEPSALRVHGVLGFDAAHKAAARLAQNSNPGVTRFFTVDADNLVNPRAWATLQGLRLADTYPDHVLSWNSYNPLNGLTYGNGGVKLWPIDWVLNMKTHEASELEIKTDFCWEPKYLQLTGCLSSTIITGSAFQAWRAGFREGVKAASALTDASYVDNDPSSYPAVLRRLVQWMSVGKDVLNGDYAMLGAMQGYLASQDRQVTDVIDYKDFFAETWFDLQDQLKRVSLTDFTRHLRSQAQSYLGFNLPVLGSTASQFCKLFNKLPNNTNLLELELWTTPHSL